MKKLSTRFEVSASNFWVRNVKTSEVGQKCQSRLYQISVISSSEFFKLSLSYFCINLFSFILIFMDFAFSWIFNDSDQSQSHDRFHLFFSVVIFLIFIFHCDSLNQILIVSSCNIFMEILLVILVFLDEKDYYRHHSK
jgi:hypothetical protein